MLRSSLRLLFLFAAASLLPGTHALPAAIPPQYPESPHVTSHGMAGEPVFLLGRHYTLASKRNPLILTGPAAKSLALPAGLPAGLPGAAPQRPVPANSGSGRQIPEQKAKTDTRPKPRPVERRSPSPSIVADQNHEPDSEVDEVERREVSDVNYLSDVGPVNVPAAAPSTPPAPPPPPPQQPPYSAYATPTPSPAHSEEKKGKSKTKKDKVKKSKEKEDKKVVTRYAVD